MTDDLIIIAPYQSPCGTLVLGDWNGALCMCDWLHGRFHARTLQRLLRHTRARDFVNGDSLVIDMARRQLDEYFARIRRNFDIPLLYAGTEFQTRVWDALRNVVYGSDKSYSDLASDAGLPAGVRAVANAVGANTMSVIIPCHRIIGSDGRLTGYAGGLEAKRYLLELERHSNRL